MKTTVILTEDSVGKKEVLYLNDEGTAKAMGTQFFIDNGIKGITFDEILEELRALTYENDYYDMDSDIEFEFDEDEYVLIEVVAQID